MIYESDHTKLKTRDNEYVGLKKGDCYRIYCPWICRSLRVVRIFEFEILVDLHALGYEELIQQTCHNICPSVCTFVSSSIYFKPIVFKSFGLILFILVAVLIPINIFCQN